MYITNINAHWCLVVKCRISAQTIWPTDRTPPRVLGRSSWQLCCVFLFLPTLFVCDRFQKRYAMPFKLRLKKSRQYNVVSKSLYVICVELLDSTSIECTLSAESVGQECLDSVCQRLGLHQVVVYIFYRSFTLA